MIPFGEWLPDLVGLGNPGTPNARNVRPTLDGFRETNDLALYSGTINNVPRGALSVNSADGDPVNYAGDEQRLWQYENGEWVNQSKGGNYQLGANEYWEMVKWLDTVIAVGGINAASPVPPQVITIGPAASTDFDDLAGNPPQARTIAVVRDFVVLGNIYESGQTWSSRMRWSGINDSEYWQTDAAKQSDFQDLKGGGAIQRIAGGEYGVVVQEKSIRRMDYTGSKTVFAIEETLPGIGTPAPRSVVRYGDVVFFLGRSGFQAVRDGSVVEDIGANKIDLTFAKRLAGDNYGKVIGAIDRANEQVVWIFPGLQSTSGRPNEAVIFDMKSARWGNWEQDCEWIYDGLGPGFTLEEVGAIYPNLEEVPSSLDAPMWVSNSQLLLGWRQSAIDAYAFGAFEGATLPATIDTREQMLSSGRTHLNKVRPDVELTNNPSEGDITVQALFRDNIGGAIRTTSESNSARDGNFSARSKAYYHTLRTRINAAFQRARGIIPVTLRTTRT